MSIMCLVRIKTILKKDYLKLNLKLNLIFKIMFFFVILINLYYNT